MSALGGACVRERGAWSLAAAASGPLPQDVALGAAAQSAEAGRKTDHPQRPRRRHAHAPLQYQEGARARLRGGGREAAAGAPPPAVSLRGRLTPCRPHSHPASLPARPKRARLLSAHFPASPRGCVGEGAPPPVRLLVSEACWVWGLLRSGAEALTAKEETRPVFAFLKP